MKKATNSEFFEYSPSFYKNWKQCKNLAIWLLKRFPTYKSFKTTDEWEVWEHSIIKNHEKSKEK
jgi:hypothetical protein